MTARADYRRAGYRITIPATVDRRRAEALALELRRCLAGLGIEGFSVSVTPGAAGGPGDPGRDAAPAAGP